MPPEWSRDRPADSGRDIWSPGVDETGPHTPKGLDVLDCRGVTLSTPTSSGPSYPPSHRHNPTLRPDVKGFEL